MELELNQGEEIVIRENDDKFILSNQRVWIKQSAGTRSIALGDIRSMKIIREKNKSILIAGVASVCIAFLLMFFDKSEDHQSSAIASVFGLVGILRYYTISKRSLEFTLNNEIYIYRADNILFGELMSLVRAIEKVLGKENSTEIVDYTTKF